MYSVLTWKCALSSGCCTAELDSVAIMMPRLVVVSRPTIDSCVPHSPGNFCRSLFSAKSKVAVSHRKATGEPLEAVLNFACSKEAEGDVLKILRSTLDRDLRNPRR